MRKISLFIVLFLLTTVFISFMFLNPGHRMATRIGGINTSAVFPAEFERQQSVWLMWPAEIYNTGKYPVNTCLVNIIQTLSNKIRVSIIVANDNQLTKVKNLLESKGINSKKIQFVIIKHQSIWARDIGPIFTKVSGKGLQLVDFAFNNYGRNGNQDYINSEGKVDFQVAGALSIPVINTRLVSEGGSIESNGHGIVMTTESVALQRNPNMNKQQIEDEYKRVLGVKKVIWLKKGLAEEDNITGGHIDEIARFADADTILLAQVLPADRYASQISQESYLRLEEDYQILRNATDLDGKPFRIIRIPMPATLYEEINDTEDIPVRSYLNYLVTNNAVLIPSYWKPGRSIRLRISEARVKYIFKSVFPGHDVISIDAENINQWGGGIHCVTQHMPAD